ncbi:MAG TPA: leucyl aminopeptidase [Vicinamibacterales bacterium]|jgi:leucyl aminopeptidase|nr:leucyl aminopeptidase [Vicinamibacterales bacterium]
MTLAKTVATIDAAAGSLPTIDTDVLALPVFENEAIDPKAAPVDSADGLADADRASGGQIARALASREFTGRAYDVIVVPVVDGRWRAGRLALVGAGPRATADLDRMRRVAAAFGIAAGKRRFGRVAFAVRGVDPIAGAQAAAEGLTLAAYSGGLYKTVESECVPPREATIASPGASEAAVRSAVERGRVLADCCNLSRTLCNEPGNVLTPKAFADRAAEIARDVGLGVEILDEFAIEKLGMGLLAGVARGSAEPARVIVLRHEPKAAPASPVLGLVGKGITFDTGGISIKPADGMDRMKDDMAGGAAVICAMRAMAILGAPMRVIGIVPATENMPGGRATKPGDVLRGASGKTVEVNNTDAEGRLILGDGLWYAQQLGATHLVDIATLTGACVVALGKHMSGLFGRPDHWVEHVRRVAARAGDRAWPLPLHDDYAEQLKSEIADLVNSGGRPAGAITAAMFLKEFAGPLPWVHLDIAGTAWTDDEKPWQAKGATGVAVRTLAELAFTEFP